MAEQLGHLQEKGPGFRRLPALRQVLLGRFSPAVPQPLLTLFAAIYTIIFPAAIYTVIFPAIETVIYTRGEGNLLSILLLCVLSMLPLSGLLLLPPKLVLSLSAAGSWAVTDPPPPLTFLNVTMLLHLCAPICIE